MKKLVAMVVPILPGKTEQWKKFTNELKGKWFDKFIESRKNLKVHERTFLQTTPVGDLVIVTVEGDDPESAIKNFALINDDFSNWFTGQVMEIHGFDLRNPSPPPLPELVIDTEAMVLQS